MAVKKALVAFIKSLLCLIPPDPTDADHEESDTHDEWGRIPKRGKNKPESDTYDEWGRIPKRKISKNKSLEGMSVGGLPYLTWLAIVGAE